MFRIKRMAILLACAFLLTACGEQKETGKVMLYQGDKKEKDDQHYKVTKVRRDTYEEKVSSTASIVYQNEKTVMINDSNAVVDRFCVKDGQKVKKGDTLAVYHVKVSNTKMKKKKLELEQERTEYDANLKKKRNEVLLQERSLKNLTDETEKKLAKLQLKRLKNEYKSLISEGKEIQKKEKAYRELKRKRKGVTLKSKYNGMVDKIAELSEDTVTGETLMSICNENDFLLAVKDVTDLRYNMEVDIGLGNTLDNIKYHIKGRVISTDNLQESADVAYGGDDTESSSSSSQLVRIEKSDRQKYDFTKYNIYVSGTTLKIEDALLVDADAVNEETEEEQIKNYVYIVENGALHKRYIVCSYKQEKMYVVNQGLEEGQTLAILSK